MNIKTISAILLLFYASIRIYAQDVYRNPNTDLKLLQKFQNAKLGMFVHWMACHTPQTGDSWSIGNPTPKSIADSISLSWNPINFDAKNIVSTAKRLGCNYMVVIAKHHDGFAIWPTQYSAFNVTKTAFKKDILKELSVECKKQGLLFGIYYSIADIDYCGWKKMPGAFTNEVITPVKGKDDFIQFNKNQVKELISNYDPDILWFDGFWLDPYLWTPKEGKMLYDYVKTLKWRTLSTRYAITYDPNNPKQEGYVNNGTAGDFFGVEAKTQIAPNYPWEGCTSVSFPVYAYEPNAKLHTAEELINLFDRTICGNGNFLLNIGPKRTGELPTELVNRFNELSDWIKPNSQAIYKTKGGPFMQGDWGGSTYATNKIYLHIRQSDTTLTLPIKGYQIKSIQDLSTNVTIPFKKLNSQYYQIFIPKYTKEHIIPIITLELDKPFVFKTWLSL